MEKMEEADTFRSQKISGKSIEKALSKPSGILIDTTDTKKPPAVEKPKDQQENLTPAERIEYTTYRTEASKKLADVRFRTSLEGLNPVQIMAKIIDTLGHMPAAAQKYMKNRNFKHLSTIQTQYYLIEVNMRRDAKEDNEYKIDFYNRSQFAIDGTHPENKSDVKPLRQWLEFKNEAIRVLAGVKSDADLKKTEPIIDGLIQKYGITDILKDRTKSRWPVNHIINVDMGNRFVELHIGYNRENAALNKNKAAHIRVISIEKVPKNV